VEGSCQGLLSSTIPAFVWREKPKKPAISITYLQVKIKTQDLLNTKQKYYPLDCDTSTSAHLYGFSSAAVCVLIPVLLCSHRLLFEIEHLYITWIDIQTDCITAK
jgi:hypothetical protein